jgi:glycosyltransferase involved in cell wall biosynthesis
MNVSVCMATYNGQVFVREQLDSILRQLSQGDEIVLVDDCSTDDTVDVVRSLSDARIKLNINPSNLGHVRSFERAISLAANDLILLADQDDVWLDGRLELLIERLLITGTLLAASNFALMDDSGAPLGDPTTRLRRRDSGRHLSNIIGILLGTRPYFGCAMALRRDLLAVVLPIPGFVEAHDLWLAMAANVLRSVVHVDEKSLTRRLHRRNVTARSRRPLGLVIKSRLIFALALAALTVRATLWRWSGSRPPKPISWTGRAA